MHVFGESLPLSTALLLFLALACALAFEFVNGFHDTANAVATVIYTHSLKPWVAVIWSGIWNFIGVLTSTGIVAFGVVALLPVELVLNVGSSAGFAMVFSLLLSAIVWNLGTWYLGLPASSSHTLIGSILGVGLAYSAVTPGQSFGAGVNWGKANEVFAALLISPVVGFVFSALLLLISKRILPNPALYQPADPTRTPPLWIRSLLIFTSTGVSFAHGSNDGQKGMGLIMLILIGLVPGAFALNPDTSPERIQNLVTQSRRIQSALPAEIAARNERVTSLIADLPSFSELSAAGRTSLRTDLYLTEQAVAQLLRDAPPAEAVARTSLESYRLSIRSILDFIPVWVKFIVAVALGLGTMIGWQRIVITVGERIGKQHLSYGQGASAELVAMTTILIADTYGLPVSTTHVLSSGIAGTMVANGSGLQSTTMRNILLAWVLTLPVCVLLGAGMFSAGFYLITNFLV